MKCFGNWVGTLLCCAASALAYPAFAQAPKDATAATRQANDKLRGYLNFADRQDFEDARRGFIADLPSPVIKGSAGNVVLDLAQYDFLKGASDAPDRVNPSLWRQSQILEIRGLFKVVD